MIFISPILLDVELEINKIDIEATKDKEINKIDLIDEVKKQIPVNKDTEDIFIDENDLFDGDDVSPEDKKFIVGLIDRTNFAGDREFYDRDDETEINFVSERIKTLEKMDQDEIKKGKKPRKYCRGKQT